MRRVISWTVENMPAMNTLVAAILLVGVMSFAGMRREVFPEFELEIILVSVPYPGATPEEVEEGICQKVEEACRSVSGIKKLTSVAQEGVGFCVFELGSSAKNVQRVLSEIRSEVERIPSLPELAEDPKVGRGRRHRWCAARSTGGVDRSGSPAVRHPGREPAARRVEVRG